MLAISTAWTVVIIWCLISVTAAFIYLRLKGLGEKRHQALSDIKIDSGDPLEDAVLRKVWETGKPHEGSYDSDGNVVVREVKDVVEEVEDMRHKHSGGPKGVS